MDGWLWHDRRNPDTCVMLFTREQDKHITSIDQLPFAKDPASNNDPARHSRNGSKRKARNPDQPGAADRIIVAALPPGSKLHHLHWTVLSGASEYFRRLFASSIGSLTNKNSSSSTGYHLSEHLEEGQLEAAASVFQTMYTHEIPPWGGAPEAHIDHLLLMFQVSMDHSSESNSSLSRSRMIDTLSRFQIWRTLKDNILVKSVSNRSRDVDIAFVS